MTMNLLRIFRVNVRLRKMFEFYNSLTQWRFNDLDNLTKISKIFLRCTLTLKILKKFIVICSKKIHFCEFFQNFLSLYAFSIFKGMFFRSTIMCTYLKVKIAISFRIFQSNLTNRLFFLTRKLLLFHVFVLKLLQMEEFIFFWDTLVYIAIGNWKRIYKINRLLPQETRLTILAMKICIFFSQLYKSLWSVY